jgi:hypothetical protein
MKLTKEQIKILKSISGINNEIYMEKDRIGVSTNSKETKVYYSDHGIDITDSFGIKNMSEFLSIVGSMTDPEIENNDKKISITAPGRSAKIVGAEKDCITIATDYDTLFKEKITGYFTEFELSKDELSSLTSMAKIIGGSGFNFIIENKTITSCEPNNSSANNFLIDISPEKDIPQMVFEISQFDALISDDYTIKIAEIGDVKILVAKSKSYNLEYVLIPVVI